METRAKSSLRGRKQGWGLGMKSKWENLVFKMVG